MKFNKNGKLLAVIFTTVCMFVAMLGGFIGLFSTAETTPTYIADAATSSDYYASLEDDLNLRGDAFRAQVADLITDTHKTLTSYAGLLNIFPESDADPNKAGNILWFYTGTSVKMPTNFNSGTNREHVWPKNGGNAFPESTLAGSDAHHLRPTDNSLNSTRSDNSFGEVPQTNTNIVAENGSKSYANLCYQANSTFYPGVGYRGATARILMYMQTRWGDAYNLKFVLGNGNNKTIGDIETLMKWHIEEPPTAEEIVRNNVVFGIQGNRNPFIDHPEYAEMIYCHDGENYNDELQTVVAIYGSYLDDLTDPTVEVESISISADKNALVVGETSNLNVSINPSKASKEVTWTSSNPSVATVNNGTITALSAGTTTITATSVKTPSKSATLTITVKSLSAITVTGTPTKTKYEAGQTFNPAGLTVTAKYSDNSTAVIPNSQLQWLDGTTRQATLAVGTTTVIAKLGNIEKTVTGISVTQATSKTFTISRASFSGSGAYAWTSWSTDGFSGYGFMYPNNKDQIQMNTDKTAKYIYNTTSIEGGIKSITIKGSDGKTFEVRTSSTPFAQNSGAATGGTVRGTITASADGTKLDINTTDTYFAITYTSSKGAVYLDEIIIEYGIGGGSTCSHVASDWIIDSQATCKVAGSKHKECTECGEVLDAQEIPTSNHSYGSWTTTQQPTCSVPGIKTQTCSVCNHVNTDSIATTEHAYGNWSNTSEPKCNQFGSESRTCSLCGNVETRQIEKTQHTWSQWVDNGNGTESRECSVCHESENRACANMQKVAEFETSVSTIQSATGIEAKWTAIGNALAKYNGLTESEKDAATYVYALLEGEISAYNATVGSINEQSNQATNDAINLLAGTISILAFASYLLLKKA